jgi:hypothetical protein
MSIESLANDVVFREAWRRGSPAQGVEKIPDHIELVFGWSEFIYSVL